MDYDFFKVFKMSKNLQNTILFVIGILLLCFPTSILQAFSIVIGVVILAYGAWGCLMFISNYKETAKDRNQLLNFIIDIVAIILSISIFINPSWVISVMYIIVGAIVIANGIKNIVDMISNSSVDSNISLTIIIISTILIILGVIIIANPNGVANFILRLEGISLIVDSITNWFILYKIDKEFN